MAKKILGFAAAAALSVAGITALHQQGIVQWGWGDSFRLKPRHDIRLREKPVEVYKWNQLKQERAEVISPSTQ